MPNKPRTDHPNYHHGPPPVEYDLRIIEDMASFGCTVKEIATICGFGESRFRALRQEHPDIQESIDLGRARLCHKLRKKQVELALDGNDKMLIFLGKALLEQSDRVEINQHVQAELVYVVQYGETEDSDSASEAARETADGSE